MTTDTTGAQERAKETAGTAVDEGKHVASVATEQARGVASEAKEQARSVVNDTVGQLRGQLDDQGKQQKDQLAGTLATFGDDLSRMAENGSGLAANVASEVASRVQSFSQHLDSHEPAELLDDVRRFARQRPGTFLLGALAAGVVAGRLLRGTKDAVEAAEAESSAGTGTGYGAGYSGAGYSGTDITTAPPAVTPGAPLTSDSPSSHGQATQPSTQPPPGTAVPPATGYSSPPVGTGLPEGVDGGPEARP